MKAPVTPMKPVKTMPMKRVPPPGASKAPLQVSKTDNTEAMVETLRQRVNELEARLSLLESVISVQNQDVVINSTKSVLIQAAATVEISGTTIQTSASMTENNAGIAKFTGVVQCDTLIATSVVASSYTPGAGNVW